MPCTALASGAVWLSLKLKQYRWFYEGQSCVLPSLSNSSLASPELVSMRFYQKTCTREKKKEKEAMHFSISIWEMSMHGTF